MVLERFLALFSITNWETSWLTGKTSLTPLGDQLDPAKTRKKSRETTLSQHELKVHFIFFVNADIDLIVNKVSLFIMFFACFVQAQASKVSYSNLTFSSASIQLTTNDQNQIPQPFFFFR